MVRVSCATCRFFAQRAAKLPQRSINRYNKITANMRACKNSDMGDEVDGSAEGF